MPAEHLPPPTLITDPAGLRAMLSAVAGEPAIAVDTESNSLFVYRERVCLIQFSTPRADYILDPLAVDDLSALGPLFADPARQKIFHAAEYDLICLKRDYGFEVNHIFDTMIAARALGWPQIGLAAILQARFGVTLNKKFQRANWGRRPLQPEQLDYARLDTHFLVALRDQLLDELERAGHLAETREEFERLTRVAPPAPAPDAQAFWSVSGARDLTPRQASLLRELYKYRDAQARRADRPPFKVMGDQTLTAIARSAPQSDSALKALPGMTAGQMRRHAAGLLAAVRRGLAAAPVRPPRAPRESDEVRDRYERLRLWRKRRAKARGVESDVIAPRDALWEIARLAPRTAAELERLEHLGPWRRQAYGEEILKVLAA